MAKSKSKKNQKYMIYLVAAIMLFSGFFWMTRTVDPRDAGDSISENPQNVVNYNVMPAINGSAIVRVGTQVNELVAIPKRPETIRQEQIFDVLNASFDGVSQTSAELSNAYVLFRFSAYDLERAQVNLSSALASFIGDVKLYGVYDGLVGTGRIQLIADLSLEPGGAVRAIIFERKDTFQTIGLQQSLIAVGPVVPATVESLGGIYVQGETGVEVNDPSLSEEFGAINIANTPKEGAFSLSFIVSDDKDRENIHQKLTELGVSDVSFFRQGFVTLPGEIVMGDDILQPTSAQASFALLALDANVNDSVNVSVSYDKEGGVLTSVEIIEASLL